ncbi:MAG: rod-binding protein [Rhodobacteraceae bacterium]|nr:rod-binding protein [Paracoccaceae bacterium]
MELPMELPRVTPARDTEDPIRVAARELEVQFLSEMLQSAGIGEARTEFGGGAGEEHFASYLREAQARSMVAGGGLGLSDAIYQSLLERTNE